MTELAQSNGEAMLQNNVTAVNVFGVENLHASGYSAFFVRSKDQSYVNGGVAYEHFAEGFGQSLSLAGQTGFAYTEASRFTGGSDAAVPPPEYTIQTTGGVDATGGTTLSPCTTTNGSTSVTVPTNSLSNGMAVSGLGIAPGSTIVSGAGTTTLVLSLAATATGGGKFLNFSTPAYGQWNRMVFHNGKMPGDYAYGIGFYTWANGKNSLLGAPFLYLDQVTGRVEMGDGSIDNKTLYGTAPLNVVDAGTAVFNSVRTGVNTMKFEWAATPARFTFKDGNAGAAVLSLYMDGTKQVAFGGAVRHAGYTVATLPTGSVGMQAYVTDGDAALAWGVTVVNSGAGATKYLVWHNGTNWTVAGK